MTALEDLRPMEKKFPMESCEGLEDNISAESISESQENAKISSSENSRSGITDDKQRENHDDVKDISQNNGPESEPEASTLGAENAEHDESEAEPEASTSGTEKKESEDEWLDIIGSGDFKKKIIKHGKGVHTRPKKGDLITANITIYKEDGILVEKHEPKQFIVGDMDIIQGIELATTLMEDGECAKLLIPSRLAYGKLGREPDIPAETNLECDVEILNVEELDVSQLPLQKKLELGTEKRNNGNCYYDRADYISAIHCYERASEYLDSLQNCSDSSASQLQEILEERIKVYNNMAATHLKLEAYDAALTSVDFVLKIQPKNVKAHFRKGKILASKGMTEEAIKSMKTAANLDPEIKIIQQEIGRLIKKKKQEEMSERAVYQRMFREINSLPEAAKRRKSWVRRWSMVAGGIVAAVASFVAYRQFHT